jgi:endonuclease/exonuclease/phosphatase family metal-dependent hydrolase
VRIAFFNIQCGVGVTQGYWQYLVRGHRYVLPHDDRIVAGVAQFVEDLGVDVLGCAEMEGRSMRSSGVDYAARLAATSHLSHFAFYESHRVGGWACQGNSIHARQALQPTRTHALPGPGEPRVLGEASVTVDSECYDVFVTHLSLGKRGRASQIACIAEIVAGRRSAVLMRDFNTSPCPPRCTRGSPAQRFVEEGELLRASSQFAGLLCGRGYLQRP